MNSISSGDGTSIAFDRTGPGPAVMVVVGAFCDRHPLLATAGSAGPWAVGVANAMAAAAPDGEVRILEGCGHDVPKDVPVSELKSFFD